MFFSILTAPPPPTVTNLAIFIWCVKYKTTTVCKKNSLVTGGGGKLFLFPICWTAKTVFSTHIFNWYLCNEKKTLADNSSVEPTIFFMEKYHFLWIFSLAIFLGNASLRLSEVLRKFAKCIIHSRPSYRFWKRKLRLLNAQKRLATLHVDFYKNPKSLLKGFIVFDFWLEITAFERLEILLSFFASIWNHQPFVSIQLYDSAVESVINFTFTCDAPRNVALPAYCN